MTRRVGIVGLEHETNTFRPTLTPLSDFTVTRGEQILTERGSRTYAAGMIDGIEAIGAEVVPLVLAGAQPSGVIASDAYRSLRQEIVDAAVSTPLDAVVVQLHGAGVAEGIDDLEADLGAALRTALGPDMPLLGSLDLHANLTPATIAHYDALTCVKFYPHTDMYDRGREAAEWVAHRWAGESFDTAVVQLPWLLLPTATSVDGTATAIEWCDHAELAEGVLDATFVHGFPIADGPQVGASVLVTTLRGRADAGALAADLARRVFGLRERCHVDMFEPAEAVRIAVEASSGADGDSRPVVLAETSDNPGGGGVGDGTHLLRELLVSGAPAVFASILDPAAAEAAHAAGVGAVIDVSLGGRLDVSSGGPIESQAEVVALAEGRYEIRKVGWKIELGRSALLRIGSVEVVVTSGNQQVFDDGPFTMVGVDVRHRPLVALKSANHFREYYRRVAKLIVPVLGPGLSHQSTSLPWQRVRRPMWPLDRDVVLE